MKTGLAIRSTLGIVMLTAAISCVSQVSAQTEYSPEQLLVGKWRQQIGGCTAETVYTANGRFTSITGDEFTAFYSQGRWQLRDGMLVCYFENWSPREIINVDGSVTPIRMPEWESTWITFLDYNRVQTKTGIAYRVR